MGWVQRPWRLPARVETPLAPSKALLQCGRGMGSAQCVGRRARSCNPSTPGPRLTTGMPQPRSRPQQRAPAAAEAPAANSLPAAAFQQVSSPSKPRKSKGERRSSTGTGDGPSRRVNWKPGQQSPMQAPETFPADRGPAKPVRDHLQVIRRHASGATHLRAPVQDRIRARRSTGFAALQAEHPHASPLPLLVAPH